MAKKDGLNNTLRVRLDTFLAHAGRLIGWVGVIFWGALGVYGISEALSGQAQGSVDGVMGTICLILAALHGFLIFSASGIRDLIQDFRLYSAALAKDSQKSIVRLAETMNLPLEKVLERLQKMCKRGYFNGYLDYKEQYLSFPSVGAAEKKVVFCPGCGARNTIARAGDVCRYCGAPLSKPQD